MNHRVLTRGFHKFQQLHCNVQYKPALRNKEWQAVIGLEIHAQIASASKLFARVSTKYGAPPNTQVSVFEAAHPGTLPVLNKRCVEAAIKTAIALGATVNKTSRFDRKHYFYPDLPAGYQITQSEFPIASNGKVDFTVYDPALHNQPYRRSVDLIQLQLEEDSGKSTHDTDNNRVLVDLNRAGIPLMELVFGPQLHSGEEAAALVKEVALILSKIETCNCRMHEGSLRVDANISVHKPGEPLGTRTEVKNLNSIRSVVKAVDFEIERQITVLESGGSVVNETRSFDGLTKETVSMRDKEVIQDYRFMPEPNLLPLRLYDSSDPCCDRLGSLDVHEYRSSLPELPEATRQRLVREYDIKLETADRYVNEDDLMEYFLAVVSKGERNPQLVSNLLLNNLLGVLNTTDTHISKSPLSPSALGEIVDLQQAGKISSRVAEDVIGAICVGGDPRSPTQIIHDNNWIQLSDEDSIGKLVDSVLHENPQLVDLYKKKQEKKKKKPFQALMQKILTASNNRANMSVVKDVLLKKLDC